MKFATKWFAFITLFASVLVLGSCDSGGGEKTEEEIQLDKLKGTWTMTSVENDGVDRSDEYVNMVITLGGTYTEGGVYTLSSDADEWPSISPWNDDDTWKFNTSDVENFIVRQSDLNPMKYTLTNSDAQLTIDFEYGGPGFKNSRTSSVTGNWTFTFTK